MNPDRLFNYLDGKLSPADRAAVEKELMDDPAARREFDIARKIHASVSGGGSEEVILPELEPSGRGAVLGRRVAIAFAALVAFNVLLGLVYIARHENSKTAEAKREAEMRAQLSQAIDQRAPLAAGKIAADDLRVIAPSGELDPVADRVVALAQQFGGSATKGLPDDRRLTILGDVPGSQSAAFREAINAFNAGRDVPKPDAPAAATGDKESFVVTISEAAPAR